MSGHGASLISARCWRLFLFLSLFGLGGCWGGDLARKDRDVRASWAALQAADGIAIDLAKRVAQTWRRSVDVLAPSDLSRSIEVMKWSRIVDLGDPREVGLYAGARSRLLAYLRDTVETLSSPASANLAWRLRWLRLECNAALLRADNALILYNEAARTYNRDFDTRAGYFSKALLFPGRRQFALLDADKQEPGRRRQ